MMLNPIVAVFVIGAGIYLGLALLFYVLWGVSYVVNALWMMFDAWVAQHPVDPKNLRVRFDRIVTWWAAPLITPLILIGVLLYAIAGTVDTLIIIHKYRIQPVLTRWRQTYKLSAPSLDWCNNVSLANLLNRIIGQDKPTNVEQPIRND